LKKGISVKHFEKSFCCRLLIPLLLGSCAFDPPDARALQVGMAQVRITPPLQTPMAGYYHERGAAGVHDDLYARAIVIEEGGVKVALVSLDLITTRRHHVLAARQAIEARTAIPGSHVMISATHAHTGPILATMSARRIGQDGVNSLVDEYSEALPHWIAEAVVEADRRLAEASVHAGMGTEESLAFNRRFHMTDGSVGWNPGKLNPKIIKAAGPIDPDVGVVRFQKQGAGVLGVYVNYAVHLDNVGGDFFSADLPFALSHSLGQVLGEDLITVYTTGACGDVNHVDVGWGEPQKGHGNAARMGVVLAGSVLKTWPELVQVNGPLRVTSEIVELPLAPVEEAEIELARTVVRDGNDRGRANFMKLVKAHQVLDVADQQGEPWAVEVQVITLGNGLAWVALPGEIFVQLGLDLKLDSPFRYTMVAELANGSIGYVPNVRAYPQGNYEVVSARCAVGSGEKLVGAAIGMLKRIHSGNRALAK